MITVPINYFFPNNGQVSNLEERIQEAFKEENRIKVTELDKEYDSSQITELMADVTAYLGKKREFVNGKANRSDYADDKAFLNAITDEFNYTVPPTVLTFESQNQLESFIKTAQGIAGDREIKNHYFTCKLENFGLALDLKAEEIKGLDADEYPISLTFNSLDDVYNFVIAYEEAKPVKRVTSKGIKAKIASAIPSFSKKEKIIMLAISVAVILGIPIFNAISKHKPTESNQSEVINQSSSSQSPSLPQWVYGTWSVTTPYGTETIKIEGGEILCISNGDIKTASYRYENGYIKAKFPGEGGIVTTYRVDLSRQSIEYGEGIYMHKN